MSRLSRENVGGSTSHNPMGLHGLLQGCPYFYFIQLYTRTTDCSITWKVFMGKCTALSYVTCSCSYSHDDQSEVSGMVDRFLLDWTKFSYASSVFHKLQNLSAKALSLGLLGIWALFIIWYSLNSFWNWMYVSVGSVRVLFRIPDGRLGPEL
jgi:hypothetical protein